MVKLLVQAQEYQRQARSNWNLGDRLLFTDIWLMWWCIHSTMCTGARNLPLQAVTFCLSTGFTWRKQPRGFVQQGSHQPQLRYEYLGYEAVMRENNAGAGAWERFHLHTRPDYLEWGCRGKRKEKTRPRCPQYMTAALPVCSWYPTAMTATEKLDESCSKQIIGAFIQRNLCLRMAGSKHRTVKSCFGHVDSCLQVGM